MNRTGPFRGNGSFSHEKHFHPRPPPYQAQSHRPQRKVVLEHIRRPRPHVVPAAYNNRICLCVFIVFILLVLLTAIGVLTYFLYPRQQAPPTVAPLEACPPGYSRPGDNEPCYDVNECRENNGNCTHTCLNTAGSYTCDCPKGFALSINGRTCTDINECEMIKNGGCGGICFNHEGDYSCDCPAGFSLNQRNNLSCSDVDECALGRHQCSHECVNIEGSYTCRCRDGYQLHTDLRTCLNKNECLDNNGGCERVCYDKIGTFDCDCPAGFQLDQNNVGCLDADECNLPLPSPPNAGCMHTCNNTDGSFVCSCWKGWELSADTRSCVDFNECVIENGGCEGSCHNMVGSFDCSCPEGYEETASNKNCQDVDECAGVHGCAKGCENTDGSYKCTCPSGYQLSADGINCQDIDECLNGNNGGCSHSCTNKEGNFTCSCPLGMELSLNLLTCLDVDECLDNNGGCEELCNNTWLSYECSCTNGKTLALDGASCVGCTTGGIIDCANIDSPSNCYDIILLAPTTPSGVCDICLDKGSGASAVTVYCDMETEADGFVGGWTVIQRRKDATENFVRNWDAYVAGFGDLTNNFWLGLDCINVLTTAGPTMELYMYLRDAETPTLQDGFAYYSSFAVDDATTDYLMTLGACIDCTTQGDSMTYHNNLPFSTYDNDRDNNAKNCAALFNGGWWYDSCHNANPNGLYLGGYHSSFADGIAWDTFDGGANTHHYSLGCIDMKVRPVLP